MQQGRVGGGGGGAEMGPIGGEERGKSQGRRLHQKWEARPVRSTGCARKAMLGTARKGEGGGALVNEVGHLISRPGACRGEAEQHLLWPSSPVSPVRCERASLVETISRQSWLLLSATPKML